MIKYCLPVIEKFSKDALNTISSNLNQYDCFEVWLDYISDYQLELLDDLQTIEGKEFIILFRRKYLEPIAMPMNERIATLMKMNQSGLYIDLDIKTQQLELRSIVSQKLDVKLIASYHNYDAVPAETELTDLMHEMTALDARIIKFAAHCNDNDACFRLLGLVSELKTIRHKFIVTGMGELGKLVRVVAALSGNEFNFAPIDSSAGSADGQLTLSQFKKIMELTEFKNAGE